jgi:hypothetical protein
MGVKYIFGMVLGIVLLGSCGFTFADTAVTVMPHPELNVASVVAEPSTLALFGLGFFGLVLLRRRAK